ncbi:IS3 family transposase [Domibacillus iocasae]|uniref:Integrase catalytic domain-containing protein n=1 Tax=Domibacillus iocasae TaxID=1714016 RepID=A0A1E7DQT4_9BACI|nr:IS3 family transposase [Domibacillus iocasae]OES45446.1 hypothetical protein BA724_17495 [Domibacillus iocasae]
MSVQGDLRDIQLFHTARGSEFKNQLIDEMLVTFKVIKTEFISQMKFDSLEHLTLEFSDYVNWFNKLRIHGT